MLKFLFLLAVLVPIWGCEMKSALLRPELPLENEGEIFLYIQPFPHEAERLKFNLGEVSALRSDGTEYPLSLNLTELKGNAIKRQRSLASGHLPPGDYFGLLMKIKNASLKGEDEETALLVPDEPVRINFPFTIYVKRATFIAMSFRYEESLRYGFSFYPSFSVFIPDKPLFSLTGYVSNHDSHNITVFDKKSGEAAAVIETGRSPGGIVLDQRSRKAYVAISDEDAIEVIDMTIGDVADRILLSPGDSPHELSITPDSKILLAVNSGSNSVSIIDPFTLSELDRLDVGNGPGSILLDRTGRRAFVFNTLSDTISVIDIPNRLITATISTEIGPLRGQFNGKGDRLYVFFEKSPYLIVLDSFSLSEIKKIYVGAGVSSLKVDTRTDFLYVGKKHESIVDVFDPFSLMPGDFISTGGGVDYMTIDRESNNLYMVVSQKRALVIFNLISKKVIFEIDVGSDPYWVTMMGEW